MINPDRRDRHDGQFWISPVNFDPEVTAGFDFPSPLGLIDSTLRKTLYTAGATTDLAGFLRIAQALDEIGVRHESLNVNFFGESTPVRAEFELARAVLAGGFGFTTNVYADTLLSNGATPHAISPYAAVDLLLELGAEVIAPGVVPAPDGAAEVRQLDELAAVLDRAGSCGLAYTVTFAQVARRDFAQMMRAANAAVELGARRIDLMDSTSSLHPDAMKVFVRRVRAALVRPVPLTMHAHDDFGLATASAVAAATAGAAPDVSVNGVSYRCGFAALEEVVTTLEVLYGVDTGIRLDGLTRISQLVAREMGVAVAPLKPITGEYAFLKHTPGDVLACLRAGEASFPPISGCLHADVVGARVRWVWDTLSSPAMVRAYAARRGLSLTDDQVGSIYAVLDSTVRAIPSYPRWLEEAEVDRIVQRELAGSR